MAIATWEWFRDFSLVPFFGSASLPSFLFRSSGYRNEVSVPQRLVPYPGTRLAAGRPGWGTPLYQLCGAGLFAGSRTGKCFRTITSLGYPYLLFAKWILRCKPYGSGLWLGLDWTVSLDSGTF
eukprot:sb/3475845/